MKQIERKYENQRKEKKIEKEITEKKQNRQD